MKRYLAQFLPTGLLAVIILFFAFSLRVWNLTIIPAFADEAIYIRWSQVMGSEPTLRFLPLSDGKQPLYMWILMFAVRRFSDPLFVGRFLSVLGGMGTLLGIFSVSLLLFKSQKAALLSLLLGSMCPFLFFFDRMALVDSLLCFFGIWTFFFAVVTAKTGRIDAAMVTGFFLGFAWLTKSPALFFLLLLPTTYIFSEFPSLSSRRVLRLLHLVGLSSISVVIAFAMYNILRLGPNFSTIASRNLDYVWPITHVFQSPFDPLRPYMSRFIEWIIQWGPLPVFLLALLSIFSWKQFSRPKLVLLIWFLFPAIVQAEYAKVLTARYVLYTIPYLILLAGSVFSIQRFKVLSLLLLTGFVAWSSYVIFFLATSPINAVIPRSERSGYLEEWTSGYGIKEASLYIRSMHDIYPDKQIIVGTEGYFGTLPDGLQMYLNDVSHVVVTGIGLNINQVPQPLIESEKFGNLTYLLINDSRFTYVGNPETLGLTLIASYPKALRPSFVREYAQHGPQEHLLLFQVGKPGL